MQKFLIVGLLALGLAACSQGNSASNDYFDELFKGSEAIRICHNASLFYNQKRDEYMVLYHGNGWNGGYRASVPKEIGKTPEKFCS